MTDWWDWEPEALAAERLRRETAGTQAAVAAPVMKAETRIEIAGVPALRCVPDKCATSVPHVFIHGGGWVFGSSVQSLGLIRRIACQTRRPVISLDYALAPEHPYPRAIDEVAQALRHMASSTGLAGLIGGSAGAQIALHTAGSSSELGLDGLVLFCGAFRQDTTTWSHGIFGQTPGQLSSNDMQRYCEAYAMPPDAPSPDLSNAPPLFLSVGDADPLLEDTLQLHAAAQQFNGSRLEVIPGAVHGFMNDWYINPRIDRAVTDALDWLEGRCAAQTQSVMSQTAASPAVSKS